MWTEWYTSTLIRATRRGSTVALTASSNLQGKLTYYLRAFQLHRCCFRSPVETLWNTLFGRHSEINNLRERISIIPYLYHKSSGAYYSFIAKNSSAPAVCKRLYRSEVRGSSTIILPARYHNLCNFSNGETRTEANGVGILGKSAF